MKQTFVISYDIFYEDGSRKDGDIALLLDKDETLNVLQMTQHIGKREPDVVASKHVIFYGEPVPRNVTAQRHQLTGSQIRGLLEESTANPT